jgi:hypothetical protein
MAQYWGIFGTFRAFFRKKSAHYVQTEFVKWKFVVLVERFMFVASVSLAAN